MAVKKYLDLVGLQTYNTQLKSTYLSVVNRVNDGTEQDPVYRYDTKASTLNGVIPTANVTMDAGPSTDLSIATKKYVDDSVQDITSAMVFKGGITATTASNTTTLTLGDTTLGDINAGYTFKFTANESGGDTFKIGDILIANEDITHTAAATITYDSSKWTLVPSGDDVDVTSVGLEAASGTPIAISGGEDGSASGTPITGTGTFTVTHSDSGVTAGTYGSDSAQEPAFGGTASIPYVTVNATGHVTAAGTATVAIPNTAAGASTLGLVSVATNSGLSNSSGAISVNVDGDIVTKDNSTGQISVADATTTGKGVVQIGDNIDVATGVISVKTGSDSDKGVLQVGTNLSVASGVVSVATGSATASGETVTTALGVLAPDYNSIQATDGVISVNTVETSDITALFA